MEQAKKEYLRKKCSILEEIITELTGKRPEYTDNQKKRLGRYAKPLNEFLLSEVESTYAAGTILYHWIPELIGAKYDSTKSPNQKKRGRKPISQEIVDEVLRMNQNNPDWGYDKIAGTMRYLGYDICASTVRNILNDYGIIPDPERKKTGDWLLFIDMCDMWDGFLLGKKYLIHDRDPLFNKRFDMIFQSIGVEIKRLPPFTPQMNARMENFIRALKTECLDKIVVRSEAELRITVTEYLEYWNHYRPHEGIGGKIPMPYEQDMNAPVKEVSFLGGLLHGYYRAPMAA